MAQRTGLTAEVLIQSLRDQFRNFRDYRNPLLTKIPMQDFPMSGLAIFSLKFPSLLNFEEEMKKERNFSNLTALYGIEHVPSDTHMRRVVDRIETDELRPCFTNMFSRAQRAGVLRDFALWDNQYLLALDGSGYFFSDSVQCEQCIEKRNQERTKSYYHQMLGYEFEHNFGHGYKNLSANFASLMMLAFFIDQLQTIGCKWFGRALEKVNNRRTRLWELFKALYIWVPFRLSGWDMFFGVLVEPEKWIVARDSS